VGGASPIGYISYNPYVVVIVIIRFVLDLTIPNSAGAGFGDNLLLDHRIISLIKLMASTMLSAAIKRQYSSVLP